MRAKLEGNHSSKSHCGCTAVWRSLHRIAKANGWSISKTGEYDALIMNGEGTMHHSSTGWHRKMKALAAALSAGKKAYLVNTVWQANNSEYDDVLRGLSGIWVRETASQRDLQDRHGIGSNVSPDISYFYRERPWLGVVDYKNEPVKTDFYAHEFANFVIPRTEVLRDLRSITLRSSWGAFVRSLSTASFLATGRHHAIYAACAARIPFAAMEGNTHKISGLIEASGANIPVAKSIGEIPHVIALIDANRKEYEILFDWLESHDSRNSLPKAPIR